jgi:hypothetical protein
VYFQGFASGCEALNTNVLRFEANFYLGKRHDLFILKKQHPFDIQLKNGAVG